MTFFYDETGNCSKFSIVDKAVNSQDAIDNDFILDGVAFDGRESNVDIDVLFDILKLQPTQKELKFKHIQGKSSSFIKLIRNKRTTLFID